MEHCGYSSFLGFIFFIWQLILVLKPCNAGVPLTATMGQGFRASEIDYVNNNGMFLTSKNSIFALGFHSTKDSTLLLLSIIHIATFRPVWNANRGCPVQSSDAFVFDSNGNVLLQFGGSLIWSPNTNSKPVLYIELLDSGNLVMLGGDNDTVWESFRHPTDTLLPTQELVGGMELSSDPSVGNSTYYLQLKNGDVRLFVNYSTPQPYWSVSKYGGAVINRSRGRITQAVIDASSWKFYDRNNVLLLQIIISDDKAGANSTWIAVLGSDGAIGFYSLGGDPTSLVSPTKIQSDSCAAPGRCGPYYVCSSDTCQCPVGLLSRDCQTGLVSSSSSSSSCHGSDEMVNAGDGLSYFALDYVSATISATDLVTCKAACSGNCSCLALFFKNDTRKCYLFDHVGSFKPDSSSSYAAFVKVLKSHDQFDGGVRHSLRIMIISIGASISLILMLCGGYMIYLKRSKIKIDDKELLGEVSEEDSFLEYSLSGMPVRYSYEELETATNNFCVKLGQGGFGSVYQGTLPDETKTQIAVKKLEGVGQGKKEFRAEVSIIGSIHHHHLVRLNGFCTQGSHRLLAYEFMANGSLDKWIFRRKEGGLVLDWDTRLRIALGTAKGLAYLHEDCNMKIIHCDIKPENVLLDDNFNAKVSDFGLAKLMTREQSHVFTTLRGTRGYLAPEWITNYAISEKSDVYSYGMVLLEIVGGRKNLDEKQPSEKWHLPSFAFRMMQEGKLDEVVDSSLKCNVEGDESVSRAIKVALWCIQEDRSLRPCMSNVVQMLQGLCFVPEPPMTSLLGLQLFDNLFKSSSGETSATWTGSVPLDCNSDACISAVRLSAPR